MVSCALAMACQTWQPVTLVENPNAASRPDRLEAITVENARYIVYTPMVRGDSVRGWTDVERTHSIALATSNIVSARTRQVSGARTALVVIGATVAAVGTLFVLALITTTEVID
jgi:hypothetical protein